MASVQDHGGGSPSPEPSHGPPSASWSQQQHQQNRILACAMCQQRKVKCNRKFPCSNCIRIGVNCVQATLNPRRRRRRFPERELLDRVRTYESLLKQNHVHFESLFLKETVDGDPVEDDGTLTATPPADTRPRRAPKDDKQDDDALKMQSPALMSRGSEAANFWKAVRSGFGDRDRKDDDDDASTSSDDAEIRNSVIRNPWQRQIGNAGSLFLRKSGLLQGQTPAPRQSLQALHPGPAQIFLLWQTFLRNVDALLKITHPPTLQQRIAEAANNLAGVDANLEALMFGIYCAAVHSMPPSECAATFGTSKRALLATYHAACEQALLNGGFLRTSDRECLSAFFLYTLSLGHHLDPRSTYAMLGVGTRVAKTMRLDQEAANARAPPLEAELRRRLWWALVLFDARISELAQSPPVLDPTWDCRVPANANDSDFRADMKEPPPLTVAPQSKAYASEAVFAAVRAELGNALRYMEYYVALLNPALRHMVRCAPALATAAASAATPDYGDIDAMEALVHDRFLQHCDADNGLHYMAIWFTRGMIAKCRLIKYFAKYSHLDRPDKSGDKSSASPLSSSAATGAAEIESAKDRALDEALTVLESDTAIMASRLARPYSWLQSLYFPMPAYVLVTQNLARRIGGARARDVWAALHANYESRFAASDSEDRHLFKTFAGIILQAWDQCDERGRAAGEAQPVPAIVLGIKADMAAETESQAAAAGLDDAGLSTDLLDFGPGTGPGAVPVSTPSIFGALGGGPGPAYASGAGVETSGAGIYPSPDIGTMGFSGLAGFSGIGGYSIPGTHAGGVWPPQAWSWASRPQWG